MDARCCLTKPGEILILSLAIDFVVLSGREKA
jgi:hypothetical protein